MPMNALSPAGRARRVSLRMSLLISCLVFFILGSSVLLDQWIMGHASAGFIFGTAAVIAGVCVGLFAIIATIGFAVSAGFRDELKTPRKVSKDGSKKDDVALPAP